MSYFFPEKDPNEVLDYELDWTNKLNSNEHIHASLFTIDNATIDSSSFTNKSTTLWISGGIEGTTANILNRITTSQNRIMDQTVLLPIRSK